jgi:hypothetical protein
MKSLITLIVAAIALVLVACSGGAGQTTTVETNQRAVFHNVTVEQSDIRSGEVRITDGTGGLKTESLSYGATGSKICCSKCTCPTNGQPCSCEVCVPCAAGGFAE